MLVLTHLSKYLDSASHCIDYYSSYNDYISYTSKNININTDRVHKLYDVYIKLGKKANTVKLIIRNVVNTIPTVHITFTQENGATCEYFARIADRDMYLKDISNANFIYRDYAHALVKTTIKNNNIESYTRSLNNTTTYLLYDEGQITNIEIINFMNGSFIMSKYRRIF